MIRDVLSEPGRWEPLDADHPSVGRICPGCGEPLKAGQRPAFVNGVPADDEDAEKVAEGRAHTLAVELAHEACTVAWVQRRNEEAS